MYDVIMNKLTAWNTRMNGIPRKCMLIAITLLTAWLAFLLFPYCWPFVVALVFSLLLEPFVRLVSGWLQRVKIARSLATLLGMVLLFGLLGLLFGVLINRLLRELMSLVRAVPGIITWISGTAVPWARDLYTQYQDILPPYVMDMINNAFSTLGQELAKWAASLSALLTSGAWTTAMSLMDVILAVVLTVMGTYYLTADRGRIYAFFHRTFPLGVRQHSALIKTKLVKALFGQLRSQLNVSLIIICFLALSFVIYGLPYGLLAGLLIGIADALPVIGAGLFLIPWSILGFVFGDVPLGIFMACIYVGTVVVRQVFEPRIVGKNLGLYPLATMIAMYAGYQALGVLGLLGGPILLNVTKVVLEADKTVSMSPDPAGGTPQEAPQPPAEDCPTPADEQAMPRPDGHLPLPGGKKKPFRKRAGGR